MLKISADDKIMNFFLSKQSENSNQTILVNCYTIKSRRRMYKLRYTERLGIYRKLKLLLLTKEIVQ